MSKDASSFGSGAWILDEAGTVERITELAAFLIFFELGTQREVDTDCIDGDDFAPGLVVGVIFHADSPRRWKGYNRGENWPEA
jgi:hypothetical protein